MSERTLPLVLLGLGLGLGLGCRSVPATLDLGNSEAAPAKIVVEPSPKPQAGSADFSAFHYASEEILGLYGCWFNSPYEYMFRYDGEPLRVQGREFGVFTAGIRGILYYGNLNNCASELSGVETRSYSDIRPLEALAGVPATLDNHSQFGFAEVNPEFIHYARRTLIPHPEQYVDGVSVQIAYQRVFRRFFRVMALSLMTLLEHDDLDLEAKAYLLEVHRGMDGIDYLEGRFGGDVPDSFDYRDGTAMTPAMATGFWLRRHTDGSYADCWHALREVLVRFDNDWLTEQRAKLPQAARVLDAIPDPLEVP